MKIVGLMAARNEDWVLGLSTRAALMWLDALVILDHASTDRTREIAVEIARQNHGRVCVIGNNDPVWREMEHRQSMLTEARHIEPTHICYIDADEVLTGDLLQPAGPTQSEPRIRGLFAALAPSLLLEIPWLALRGSIGQVHTSGPWAGAQNASFGFLDSPELHWSSDKRGGYDFHHRQPMGKSMMPWTPLGATNRRSGLMHLQFVSGRRLRAKQALYKVTEILRWPGREPDQVRAVNERYNLAVYGQYKTPTAGELERLDATLGPAPIEAWWKPYEHLMQYFHPTRKPWQEAEVLKAIEQHGPQKFAGLDLFGIGEPAFHERG